MKEFDIVLLGLSGIINGAGSVKEAKVTEKIVTLYALGTGTFLTAFRRLAKTTGATYSPADVRVTIGGIRFPYGIYRKGMANAPTPIPIDLLEAVFEFLSFELEGFSTTSRKLTLNHERCVNIDLQAKGL